MNPSPRLRPAAPAKAPAFDYDALYAAPPRREGPVYAFPAGRLERRLGRRAQGHRRHLDATVAGGPPLCPRVVSFLSSASAALWEASAWHSRHPAAGRRTQHGWPACWTSLLKTSKRGGQISASRHPPVSVRKNTTPAGERCGKNTAICKSKGVQVSTQLRIHH